MPSSCFRSIFDIPHGCSGAYPTTIAVALQRSAVQKKLLGITAMSKQLGKTQFEELLGSYVAKPQGKPVLVPMADKRPAMHIAAAEFKEEN